MVDLALRKNLSNKDEVSLRFFQKYQDGLTKYHKKTFVPLYIKVLSYSSVAKEIKLKNPTKTILRKFMTHIEEFDES